MKILVTGGAGFIGSNLVRFLVKKYPSYKIVNFDELTYAGNLENLKDLEDSPNYAFFKGDVADEDSVRAVFEEHGITAVMHLAAESHVDRSILGPREFVRTNITGTFTLLECARLCWAGSLDNVFLNVSTDEVYGSLGPTGAFTEKTPYAPNSPYSASKASADHMVRAYNRTYGLRTVTTNCSNNYGPYQMPEKLIPLVILNALDGCELPIYGDGKNVRDWLFVEDHVNALDVALHKGKSGESYNIGGGVEMENIEIVRLICSILDELKPGARPYAEQIAFVKDRPGHDMRYAIDPAKTEAELGWRASFSFDEAIRTTVMWYLDNLEWCEDVRSGDYKEYYEVNYGDRKNEVGTK